MRFTEYFVNKKIAGFAILLVFVVLGIYGLMNLPVDFLPGITYPMIKVHIWWPGATPEEIDKNIADPVERQMATVDNLDYLESSSIEGMYTLLANFKYGVDVDVAYQDALAAMARCARELPDDMDAPVVIKADPSQLPVVQLTISSNKWNLVQLRTWVDEWFQDQLLAVQGVAGTEIVGGLKREIRIHLDPGALEKHELTLDFITQRLKEENVEQFGGRITVGPHEIIARTIGEFKSIDDIKNVLLLRSDSAKVYIKDIAEVVDSHEEARVITRLNGKACVKLSVLKQADANTVEVAKSVENSLKSLKSALPQEVSVGMVENQADYVNAALKGVKNAALESAFFVTLIVWLFLGSWKQVIVIMTALPLTLIINFGLMRLAGFSLNIFSLGGLVIAIGVLVDNSIIIIEDITGRHKAQPDLSMNNIAIDSSKNLSSALLAATFSFLALFVPFLLVPGLMSLLFKELILVIAGIVVISLGMAVTVMPMLTTLFFGNEKKKNKEGGFDKFFQLITISYSWILKKIISIRWIIFFLFIALFIITVYLVPYLGSEFLPRIDDGRIMVKVKLPTGASIDQTNKLLGMIEKKLQNEKPIENMFTLSGGKIWGLYTYEIANEGQIDIQLVSKNNRKISTQQYIKYLQPIIGKIKFPGAKIMVMQMKIKGIRKIGDADIEMKIQGRDMKILNTLALKISDIMKKKKHFKNVYVSMDITKPEYKIKIDRPRAAELGVSTLDVSNTLRTLITGKVATQFRSDEKYYNIRAMISENKILSKKNIEELPIKLSDGKYLKIKDIARVVFDTGPVEISRENQIKQVVVRGDATEVSIGQALEELKNEILDFDWPVGYSLSYGGQAQMMSEMKKNIIMILLFAFFFSFIVLTVQFNSLSLPTIIIGSVPFSFVGVILIMILTGIPIGATVIIGMLVVISATVNDGVLLLTYANELKNTNEFSAVKAVLKSAVQRLRPRVMTTISTIAGLIPLALALEAGGDMLQPMAVGAIGGLLMEMLVALFLMPCLYVILSNSKKRQSIK